MVSEFLLVTVFDREINMLERQMEETLRIEKQFQQTTIVEDMHSTAASAVMDPDSFASAGIPQGCAPAANEIEEWGVDSDNGDEWQVSKHASNLSDENAPNDKETCFRIDEASEPPLHKTECHDLDEEHLAERYVSSSNVSLTFPKSKEQFPQLSRGQDVQNCCPFGKNCCLGKRCMYSHPPSIDSRKSQQHLTTFDSISSSGSERADLACSPTEKHYSPVSAFEEGPGISDLGYPVDKAGQSCNNPMLKSKDASATNESPYPLQPEMSVRQVPECEDAYSTEQSIDAVDRVTFGHMGSAGSKGLSKDSNQFHLASGKLEDFTQTSWDNKTGLAPPPEDKSLSSQEKSKSSSTSDLQIHSSDHLDDIHADSGKSDSDGSTVVSENRVTEEESTAISDVKGPTVYVIADQSQFPLGFPAVPPLPSLVNPSAGAKLQNFPQHSQQSSSLPVNYAGEVLTGLPANLTAQTLTATHQRSRPVVAIPQTLSTASQNSAISSPSNTPETPAATQQPITAASSTSSQAGVANAFPALPGFPFLPFGFPVLNPVNAAANASLIAAAAAGGGIPFPITPGNSNSMSNQQRQFVQPYLSTELEGGVSPLGRYLPMQAPLNGLPGIAMEGNVSVPRPPLSQPQPSQTWAANNPQSTAPTVQLPFRFPFPFIDHQAFVNMNAAMALGIPYPLLQNGCPTSLQSGMTPQLQTNYRTTDPGRVEHTGAGATKPVELKPDLGQEGGETVSCGSKTPSLRRPATGESKIKSIARNRSG